MNIPRVHYYIVTNIINDMNNVMKNDNRYHSISGGRLRGLALAALIGAGGLLGGCTDDNAPDMGGDGIIALRPSVTLDGKTLSGSFGKTRAEVYNDYFAIYLGLNVDAFTGNGLHANLLAAQRINTVMTSGTTPGNATSGSNLTPGADEGTIYLPGAGDYRFTIGIDTTAAIGKDGPDVPALWGTLRDIGGDDYSPYYAPLTFDGAATGDYSATITVASDGSATFPLVYASAGVDFTFTTASGYQVTDVTTNNVAGALRKSGTDLTALIPDGKVGYYDEFDVKTMESTTDPTVSPNGKYYTSGAVIPGSYQAGDILCILEVSQVDANGAVVANGTVRIVPVLLPKDTDYKAGSMYRYSVLVDAERASIGSVSVSDFITQTEVGIEKGGEDYTYNAATNTFTVNTAKGLHAVSAAMNDDDDTNGTCESDITLTDDIDMSEVKDDDGTTITAFTPIGRMESPFDGSFKGNGFAIKNLRINSSNNYVGLISYMGKAGSVSSVRLIDPYITGSGRKVGGIAGRPRGVVIGCSVIGGTITGTGNVGGIAGECYEGAIGCYKDCSGSIAETGNTVNGVHINGSSVGGIVGYIRHDYSYIYYNTATGCTLNATSYVGYICGYGFIGPFYGNVNGGGNVDGNGNAITNEYGN